MGKVYWSWRVVRKDIWPDLQQWLVSIFYLLFCELVLVAVELVWKIVMPIWNFYCPCVVLCEVHCLVFVGCIYLFVCLFVPVFLWWLSDAVCMCIGCAVCDHHLHTLRHWAPLINAKKSNNKKKEKKNKDELLQFLLYHHYQRKHNNSF